MQYEAHVTVHKFNEIALRRLDGHELCGCLVKTMLLHNIHKDNTESSQLIATANYGSSTDGGAIYMVTAIAAALGVWLRDMTQESEIHRLKVEKQIPPVLDKIPAMAGQYYETHLRYDCADNDLLYRIISLMPHAHLSRSEWRPNRRYVTVRTCSTQHLGIADSVRSAIKVGMNQEPQKITHEHAIFDSNPELDEKWIRS